MSQSPQFPRWAAIHRSLGKVVATGSRCLGPDTSTRGSPMWQIRNMSVRSISSNMGKSRASSRAKCWNSGWIFTPWMPWSRSHFSSSL